VAVAARTGLLAATGALAALALALALAGPLQSGPYAHLLPFALLALGAIIAGALAAPLALFTCGFALLAVVRTEPAPVDVVFAVLMLSTAASGRVRPKVPHLVGIPLALFAVVSVLSAVNALDVTRAIRYEFVTLYLILFAVWLTWVYRDAVATRLAIIAYITVSLASAILAMLALYAGLPGGDALTYASSRAVVLFKDPNVYSAFLVPAAAIVLEELGRPRLLGWRRSYLVATFVVLAAGVVIGFSRAAWLNLAIAATTILVVTAFRRGGMRVAGRAAAGLVVAGVAAFALLAATGSLGFLQERSRLETYDQQRFGAQRSAFGAITDHVLGHGPGQVEGSLDISTHSLYARAAFEHGLPGLLLIVLVVAATLYCAAVLVRRDADVHGIGSAALLGIWLGLIANSIFIDTIHWRHLYVVAALIWFGYATLRPSPAAGPGTARARAAPR
jgi:O-antigen ligase